MDMFPDIRSDDIDRIAPQCDWELQRIIERILEQGAGQSCTKLPDNPLKRKAAETDSEDEDPMPTTRPRKIVQPKKIDRAKAKKNTAECQCCFTETPLDEMVYCDGESLHLFCKRCARQAAETQIGLSKFQLDCMSMSGCDGKFTLAQRMGTAPCMTTSRLDMMMTSGRRRQLHGSSLKRRSPLLQTRFLKK
ncbi:hypothetical protein S7711_01583 [Stachybotrys chartarum IBT 7711]|uniref:Uncharacterized protein n=1 Tax=Stachybotrys chartarum (strain CBS 109288 / IBT 7711) TaxID=1280523 RepID=A0A084BC52_STACB|nr:hypothetical protein S7711_01583 [Stachybotrys chartarum IBT 7711]KFA49103.1 hypothetical protein S40293_07090 [Stachybotrys chartarum IBT 40293]